MRQGWKPARAETPSAPFTTARPVGDADRIGFEQAGVKWQILVAFPNCAMAPAKCCFALSRVALVPATAPDHVTGLGAIAQFEKASLVAKMRAGRDRKLAQGVKCGGRPSHAERRPEVVALDGPRWRGDFVTQRPVSCAPRQPWC